MIDEVPILAATSFGTILTGLVLLLIGFFQAKSKNFKNHKVFMLAAVVTQAAFLVQYITRFLMGQETTFPGPDKLRNFVFIPILVIHILTAIASIYLILRHVLESRKNERPGPQFEREYRMVHRSFGKRVFIVWLASFIGGITVFCMLYLIPY